ncbi:MAG: lamin tail domain-containing protein [Verrucomicrobiota bacterium]
MGEEVFLFSGDAVGSLTGYSHGFTFEASDLGTTWGRHTLSTGSEDITQLATPTLEADNSLPKVGPVVISEIYFHPKQGTVEYVELQNITDQPVPLFDAQNPTNTWSLNGAGFDFPPDTILPPRGLALVVATTPEAFLADHTGIPEDLSSSSGPTPEPCRTTVSSWCCRNRGTAPSSRARPRRESPSIPFDTE